MILNSDNGTFAVARVHNRQNEKQDGVNCMVSQLSVVRGREDEATIEHRGFSIDTRGNEIKILV